ncbi:MAG: protease pro-enzyme activation domain-containing protein [Aliidongia sp.]
MSVSRIALGVAVAASLGFAGVGAAAAAEKEVALGATTAAKTVRFSVYLPLTHTAELEQFLRDAANPSKPTYHQWLSPAQFKALYGPDAGAVAQAKAALAAAGMTVSAEHTRSLEVESSAASAQAMFGMHLQTMRNVSSGHEREVAIEGHATVPQSLAALGAHIVGFEPHINVHVQSHVVSVASLPSARRNEGPVQGYFADDMKAAYSFPSFQTYSKGTGLADYEQIVGLGTNIGILMSSIAQNSDLALQFNSDSGTGASEIVQTYSANSNLPVPTFTIREVSGGSGPFGNSAADEASLDTQMSLGTAPGATEQLYDIPDLSDASVMAGYTAIVEDNTVDVVSSSFGGCEFPKSCPTRSTAGSAKAGCSISSMRSTSRAMRRASPSWPVRATKAACLVRRISRRPATMPAAAPRRRRPASKSRRPIRPSPASAART